MKYNITAKYIIIIFFGSNDGVFRFEFITIFSQFKNKVKAIQLNGKSQN